MKKGASTAIITVLVMLITVSLILMSYQWLLKSAPETQQELENSLPQKEGCLKIESIDTLNKKITVRNCGGSELGNFIIYIDDKPVGSYSSKLSAGGIVQISYTGYVTPGVNHNIKVSSNYADSPIITFLKKCDIYITQSMIPYTIDQSYDYYCLNESVNINGFNAINFSTAGQGSVLDCQGYTIDGNDTSNVNGVYIQAANAMVWNCVLNDWYTAVNSTNTDGGETITNNTVTSGTWGAFFVKGNNNIIMGNVANNNGFYGIYLSSSNYNTIERNVFNSYSDSGITMYSSSGNKVRDNTLNSNNWGIKIQDWGAGTYNNEIEGGSIALNNKDYYLAGNQYGIMGNNYFINTNFTGTRNISLDNRTFWFNYKNDSSSSIWLNTSSYNQSNITRKISSWTQQKIMWNDSSNAQTRNTYNVSGLENNAPYNVYNNSIFVYSFNSGSNGQISFTIDLPIGQEREIKVEKASSFCNEFISFLPYPVNKNNTYYCLTSNLFIAGQNAITFSSGIQNTTLDCKGFNIDGNGAVGFDGVYLTGINTKNNTIKNCNITDFYYGIDLATGPKNNTLINNIANGNYYGFRLGNVLNNTLINNTANNNVWDGIEIESSSFNILINNTAKNNDKGLHFPSPSTDNNIFINNIFTNNNYGIYSASITNSTIIDGSVSDNNNDYYLTSIGTTNNFTNTNFTATRKIYFGDIASWFNYNNETTGSIWLKTSSSATSTVSRKLTNWNQTVVQWYDNASSTITATYNITGLTPNSNYIVYNNSVPVAGSPFNSGSNGQINFTIYLPAGQQREIKVEKAYNILYFDFNEANGTKVYDSSGYGNDGIYYGETFNDGALGNGTAGTQPTRLFGSNCKYGSCLGFEGIPNESAEVVNTSDFMPNSSLTIMAWIYPKEIYGDERAIVSKWGSGGGTDEWLFRLQNATKARLEFHINNITGGYEGPVYSSGANDDMKINTNIWTHVAVVYDRPNKNVSFYKNGTYIGGGQFSLNGQTRNGTEIIRIGAQGGITFDPFNGTIDEVRIWNRTLSEQEINAEMQSSLPVVRPVASWSFEESGNYVNDTHIWVNGTYGSALDFDGIDDYVNVPNSNELNPSYITVSAWLFPKTDKLLVQNAGMIVKKIIWANNQGYFMQWNNDSKSVSFNIGNGTSWRTAVSTSNSVPLNKWTYLTGTYNGSHVMIYVNGSFNASITHSGSIASSTDDLKIGAESATYKRFNGTIDEVRIWNRTLSQAEIQAEMYKG